MAPCFILRRNKGGSLYLTPFVDRKQAEQWTEEELVRWHASTGLTTQEKDEALFTLYTQIDRGWIAGYRTSGMWRLLLSALCSSSSISSFSLAVRIRCRWSMSLSCPVRRLRSPPSLRA